MPHKDLEAKEAYHKEYRQRPEVKLRERSSERKDYLQKYRSSWLPRLKSKERNHLNATAVLMHYSNPSGKPVCNYCGEQGMEVLCIDHVEGGGYEHVKRINTPLYRWLIKNNYPKGFQVLCSNCNTRKSKLEY